MRRIRIAVNDAIAIAGTVLLTIGSALIYLPLGFVVPGALLLLYAVAASRGEEPAA